MLGGSAMLGVIAEDRQKDGLELSPLASYSETQRRKIEQSK